MRCRCWRAVASVERLLACRRAGQTPVQKYWKTLLKLVQEGKLDPTMVITHRMPLAEAARGYKIFNDKHEEDGTLVQKVCSLSTSL